jgi:hypothetical protein
MLTCCGTAQTDLVIEARTVPGAGEFPVRKMPSRVMSLARPAPDVAVLTMQLPANDPLRYHAGQYVEFILRDNARRSYSMANAPHAQGDKPFIELHVRHMPGGRFTDHVFGAMKEKDILRMEGPFGSFFLREDSTKPLILLASGTGYGDFTVKGLVSYTRGENRDTGDNLYNIMPLNARVALTQRLGPWRNTVEGVFVAAKDDVSAVRNEMQTAAYALANLRSRYEKKTWSVEIGIENLFDTFYDLPLGGAYVGQGTTMTVPPVPNQPQWGTPVPGPGRSFYAGVSLKF